MNAERLMLLGGVIAFVLTAVWVRNRTVRERYAVWWLALATLLLMAGAYPKGIMWLARTANLSYPAAVLLISLTLIYIFCFTVTVFLSAQRKTNVRLIQEIALLNHRIEQLEDTSKI